MSKISRTKFCGLLNECVHKFTLGKSDSDVQAAIKILENKILWLKEILARRSML